MVIFEVANRFSESIVISKTPWPLILDKKYLMVDEVWKLANEAYNHQWLLADAPVDAPSLCHYLIIILLILICKQTKL